MNYSPDMIVPNFLAPAATQSEASFLMLSRRIDGGMPLFRNTRAFLSFQMDHEMSMVKDAMAFLFGVGVSDKPILQSFEGLSQMPCGSINVSELEPSLDHAPQS